MTFATYKIDSLTSQWKVFDFFDIYFVKKFDFPEFHVLNFDFFDFPGHSFDLFEKIHFMEFDFFDFSDKMFLTLHTPFWTPPVMLSCDLMTVL